MVYAIYIACYLLIGFFVAILWVALDGSVYNDNFGSVIAATNGIIWPITLLTIVVHCVGKAEVKAGRALRKKIDKRK